MKLKLLPLAALASFSALSHAADWSDASIAYSYGKGYSSPGVSSDIKKSIVSLSYVGGFKWGVNFFNVDLLKSDDKAPANAQFAPNNYSRRGNQEVYATFNTSLSLTKLTGTPMKFGPIKDVDLQGGFDFNSQNDQFGAGLIKLITGPKVEFDVPGLLTLGVLYYKEWNNNAFAGTNDNFKGTARLSTVWEFPFNAGLPAVFSGWGTVTGSKGKQEGGAGPKTVPETWFQANLLWDVSPSIVKPKTFYAGVSYEFINNKFGNSPASLSNTKERAPSVKLVAHF